MCGITGFLTRNDGQRAGLCDAVGRMATALAHRGPDDSGVWTDAAAGVALGFRRLAILDLTATGRQPMTSHDDRFVIVFNGEIYNHPELRAELAGLGHVFVGTSDTEVVLAGALQWGAEAVVPRLWGMFAIALWDRRDRVLLLARDRIGKKPLYYWQDDATLLFASELKALRAHPAFRAEIDRDALTAYLRFGYVPAPLSIYRGVRKLPPGCLATVRAGGEPALRRYWDAREVASGGSAGRVQLSDDEAADQLDALLRDAAARRVIADVPLGAMLSGGIDSSTVVALMQAQSSRPVKTFTIGFHEAGYNEAVAAKAVASHLGTEHTELYVTPKEAQDVVPRLPVVFDEPFADSSGIPTFLVSQLARRHVTVALSGDGGDEVFGGYTRYHWAERIWRRLRFVPGAFRPAVAAGIRGVAPRQWDAAYGAVEWVLPRKARQTLPGDKAHKLADLLASRGPDDLYLRLVSLWKSPEAVAIGASEPASVLTDPAFRELVPTFTERMMLLDLVTYLPDDILVKVDRASMAVSLEARCPFLDHRVVEWAWRLPLAMKVRDGQGKLLLRRVLARYVPDELVERPKMGFGIPIDVWLRGPLREWAEDLLDEQRLRSEGFLKPDPVRAAWAGHLSGRRNDQHRLWAVLMFQAWKAAWGA